jgi:copper chaperone
MTCGGCVASVTRAVEQALPGLKIEVSLIEGKLRVDGEHQAQAVKEAVEGAGFDFDGRID